MNLNVFQGVSAAQSQVDFSCHITGTIAINCRDVRISIGRELDDCIKVESTDQMTHTPSRTASGQGCDGQPCLNSNRDMILLPVFRSKGIHGK